MTNFIPVFPLDVVVYPGERLNLHIFEPKYKQLLKECVEAKKPFGIPSVVDQKMGDLGTLMEVDEVVTEHENGELDIRTRGVKVFRILEVIREVPDKLYSGAIVTYPENTMVQGNSTLSGQIIDAVKKLYSLLNVDGKFPSFQSDVVSYTIGHFVGMNLREEYELLGLFDELQRLEYIRRHLTRMQPVLKGLEDMKKRVQMNGHFRNLSLGDLNL
jgi:uncharacterized protein